MDEFVRFVERIRKSNGEKYLSKSVSLYDSIVERHIVGFEFNQDVDKLIEFMNIIIKKYNQPNVRASFKLYLLMLGVDDEDDRLKLLKSSKRRASALTSLRVLGSKSIPRKDMELLYNSVDNEWKLILGFLYDTAVRENELLNVRLKDITFKDNEDSKIGAEVRILGKGSKYRIVFLSNQTTKLLKKLRPNLEDVDKIFVFKMKDGKLYERQEKALYDKIQQLTKRILGKAFCVHSFRHSSLQNLASNGAGILEIGSIAGHSNPQTTAIYVKSSKAISEKAYEKFSEEL